MSTARRSTCPSCARFFDQRAPWARLCVACYVANKRRALPLEQQLAEARHEVSVLRQRLAALEHRPSSPAIPATMLRRLLQLAHPDRHGNSRAANEATAWLLDQRRAAA